MATAPSSTPIRPPPFSAPSLNRACPPYVPSVDGLALYCYHAIYGRRASRPRQGSSRRRIDHIEIAICELPEPLPPSTHCNKYRLYVTRVRYDNEGGKGDHRHIGNEEFDYVFSTVEQLLDDIRSDVERWEQK
jgi:Family of unknown function (DUF6516)